MKRDDRFIDTYSLVVGVLAIIALLVIGGSMKLYDIAPGAADPDSVEYQEEVRQRIQPIGRVLMPGEELSAGEPQVAEVPSPEPVETVMSGPQVYNDACLMCHGSGIGGAPVLSDPAAWEARIAQGMDVLYQHALEGFTGNSGFMPPKGARMDLSDDDVRNAVDYMVEAAGK